MSTILSPIEFRDDNPLDIVERVAGAAVSRHAWTCEFLLLGELDLESYPLRITAILFRKDARRVPDQLSEFRHVTGTGLDDQRITTKVCHDQHSGG